MTDVERKIQARIDEIDSEIRGASLAQWTSGFRRICELRQVLVWLEEAQRPVLPELTRIYSAPGDSSIVVRW